MISNGEVVVFAISMLFGVCAENFHCGTQQPFCFWTRNIPSNWITAYTDCTQRGGSLVSSEHSAVRIILMCNTTFLVTYFLSLSPPFSTLKNGCLPWILASLAVEYGLVCVESTSVFNYFITNRVNHRFFPFFFHWTISLIFKDLNNLTKICSLWTLLMV